MKKIFAISAALVAIASVCSCTKQELKENENIASGETQTIRAYVNVGTKVAFSENTAGGGAGMTSVWAEGDFFYAIQDGSKVVRFDIESGIGTNYAGFVAETTGATESTVWTGVLGEGAAAVSSEIHCSYMGQDGTLDNLDKYVYMTASATGLEPVFNFKTGTQLTHVLRIKLPAGIKCIEYTPSAWNKVTGDGNEIVYLNPNDGNDANDFGPSKTSTITLKEATAKGDIVYLAIPCVDYSRTYTTYNSGKQNMNLRTGIVLTVMNNDSDNADLSTGYVYEQNAVSKGGSIQTLDMSGQALIKRPKPADAINIAKSDVVCVAHASALKQAGNVNTYWAPFNIGASKTSEAGMYIAFGEYFDNGVYDYVTYTLRHKPSGTMYDDIITNLHPKLTSKEGNTTFYSVTSSRYDAARILWGSAWRMPHCIEIQVLFDAAKVKATIDGKECLTFTEGGNSISIPVAGFKKNSEAKDAAYMEIWSADMCQRSASNAGWNQGYGVYIKNSLDDNAIGRFDRYAGLNIRPVLVSSTID